MRLFRRTRTRVEQAFTLLELLAVISILGLLAAIAVPVYATVQRSTVEATVKSDLRSNIPVIVEQSGVVYADAGAVVERLSFSPSNKADLVVTGDSPTTGFWCFQVGHEFMFDTFWRHYSSEDSTFASGECAPGDQTIPVPGEGTDADDVTPAPSVPPVAEPSPAPLPTPAPTPSPAPETPGAGGVESSPAPFNEVYTEGTVTYTPRYQFNAYGPGSATVQVAMTSPSSNLINWHYVADLAKGPYFGFNPSNIQFNDGQGVATIEDGKLHIRAVNQWNGVSSNRPVTVTFSISNYNPPVMPEHYKVTVTPDPWANNWYACLDVKVEGTNWFPVRWEHVIDLRSYFASLNNTDVSFQNLSATPVPDGGSKYLVKVSGNGTNNNLVSSTHSGHNAHRICYNPQGATPFVSL